MSLFSIAKKAIEALPVKCDNVDRNCKWVGTVATLREHMYECPFSLVRCPNRCDCYPHDRGSSVMRKDLDAHQLNECPKRKFECSLCKETVKPLFYELESYSYAEARLKHSQTCSKRRISCPNTECSRIVQRQNMKRHVESCEHTTFPCKYRRLGCDTRMKRRERAEHEADDKYHLLLALDTVVELQETVDEVRSSLKQVGNEVKELKKEVLSLDRSVDERIENRLCF